MPLHDGLYSRAFVLLGNADDAKDAVQETFATLWAQADRLAAMERPEAYFATTLRHTCLKMLRQRGRAVSLQAQTVPPQAQSDQSEAADRELMAELEADRLRLRRMLGRLTPRARLAVTLRYYQGLSTHEAAAAMNVSDENLRAILSRAIGQLRALLRA